MAYPIYYPTNCDTQLPDHMCSNCGDVELGRVRGVAFVKKSKTFLNISNPVEWTAAILNKDVIIIPQTKGTFDGGAEVTGEGYGDQIEKLNGYNFTLQFQDPDLRGNGDFYNELKRSRNYYVVFKTDTQVFSSEKVVQVVPKSPVTTVPTDEVVWDVTVKWANEDVPVPVDAPPGTFTCFDYL